MNILPFVFAMLAILSIMTYAKLQVFLGNASIQSEYVCYMKGKEIHDINLAQKNLFTKEKIQGPKTDPKAEAQSERVLAERTINFFPFINQDARNKDPIRFNILYEMVKKLLGDLYQNQPFFIQAQENRGDLIDELLQAIMEKSSLPQYKDIFRSPSNLANVDLEDNVLQNVLIEMLKGSDIISENIQCRKRSRRKKQARSIAFAYPSLKTFINVEKSFKPLRVWLASKELLKAIFEDENFVNTIIEERQVMQRHLKKFKSTALAEERKKSSVEFQRLFEGKVPADWGPLLNFQVSTTPPPEMES